MEESPCHISPLHISFYIIWLASALLVFNNSQVQISAIQGVVSQDKDVIIHAYTGSGKTLAYLLPLIDAMDPQSNGVQVYPLAVFFVRVTTGCCPLRLSGSVGVFFGFLVAFFVAVTVVVVAFVAVIVVGNIITDDNDDHDHDLFL